MANPQGSMVPPGPSMAGQAMVPGSSGQMHPRAPRPPSQSGKENHSHSHPANTPLAERFQYYSIYGFHAFSKILELSDVSLTLLWFRRELSVGNFPQTVLMCDYPVRLQEYDEVKLESSAHRCNGPNAPRHVCPAATAPAPPGWPPWPRPHAPPGSPPHAGPAGRETAQPCRPPAAPAPAATGPAGPQASVQPLRPDPRPSGLEPCCPGRPGLEESPTPGPDGPPAPHSCLGSDPKPPSTPVPIW